LSEDLFIQVNAHFQIQALNYALNIQLNTGACIIAWAGNVGQKL